VSQSYLGPDFGPRFGTDPDLGPRFGTPIWDPEIWDPDLGPRFGIPIWDPDLGPQFERILELGTPKLGIPFGPWGDKGPWRPRIGDPELGIPNWGPRIGDPNLETPNWGPRIGDPKIGDPNLMYFLPTVLPCSGRYSGQRVHKKIQKIQ
jgi:hypothetical protein